MQLLNEVLIALDNMKCDTCKLKDQCNKMKEEKDETSQQIHTNCIIFAYSNYKQINKTYKNGLRNQ